MLISIALLGVVCAIAASSEPRCVWYGQCHSSLMGYKQNCEYDGPPKPLNRSSKAWKTFIELCPRLVEKAKESGLCCDPAMIETFSGSMAMPKNILGKCPSCYHNFRNLWCQSTCSPNQAQFLKVIKTAYNDKINASYVKRVRYYVTKNYSINLFDSCKGAKMEGGLAAIALMCGGKEAANCTAKDWLTYLGDNGFVPFTTEFSIVDGSTTTPTGIVPMNDHVVPCNRSVDPDSEACPCEQCPTACSPDR